jgi:hypothetical protein
VFDKRSDGLAQHRLLSKGSLLGCSLALKLERTAPAAVDHHPVELSTFVFRRSCDESFVALTGGVPVPAPPGVFLPGPRRPVPSWSSCRSVGPEPSHAD